MRKLLPIVLAAFLTAPAAAICARSDGAAPFGGPDGAGGDPTVPGGLIPDDDAPGPVANVDAAEHKFDGGFYDKIQGLMAEAPTDGDPGVYDGERYYNVLIVVGRDDGDGRGSDETAKENKDAVVKRLQLLGARDITAAESLSFVTASVPVADVPGFSLHDEVYAIGDGELPVTLEVDKARTTINATSGDLRTAVGRTPDGAGVIVAVVDNGINSVYLNSKVTERIYCLDDNCPVVNGRITGRTSLASPVLSSLNNPIATHGTQVAQVLAASGMPRDNGIATGVTLLDARYGGLLSTRNLAHSLDWSYVNGADVANISAGAGKCIFGVTYNLILNEAVDKGMVVVKSAGNGSGSSPSYASITNPGCAHNSLTVGGINDRESIIKMYTASSRGPVSSTEHRLVPHIVAPAYRIDTLNNTTGSAMNPRSGTSLAAPQVSATAAMMLQLEPELTPAEVKAALLLGADWQGPVPCTSVQYEANVPTDNCSYAKQFNRAEDFDKANNAASLGILNNTGFGVLDTANSLKYVHSLTSYVVSGHLDAVANPASKQYRFVVTDTSKQVKVILAWMAHPHGGIEDQARRTVAVPMANLDFTITPPSGSAISANSSKQNTEFAVFKPKVTGTYTVTVSGSNTASLNKPVQTFALASTNPLTELPTSPANRAPVAQSGSVVVSPGQEVSVHLSSTDSDGDAVSYRVSRDPAKGTVTTDELLTKTVSRVTYTPNGNFAGTDTFQVTPHDGLVSGTAATITLTAESLPSGARDLAANSANVRDWDTYIPDAATQSSHSKTSSGPSYSTSTLYVGSVNMEGVDLSLTTTGGTKYTVAVPESGVRMIQLSSPVSIRSVTLSADGVDEEAAHSWKGSAARSDIRMFVGYVPSTCSSSSASGSSSTSSASNSCPATASYRVTSSPGTAIPDNTRLQSVSDAITITESGTLTALSVSVDITHSYRGDLKVVLTSASGTQVTLHNRQGSGADNIKATYSGVFGTMLNSSIKGNWALSVGDYAAGDTGVLKSWSINATYTPTPTSTTSTTPPSSAVFSDNFESTLSKWIETGDGNWRTTTSQSQRIPTLPGSSSTNKVLGSDNCDNTCTITLKTPINLSNYSAATLSFSRILDSSLDRGEYLKVELYNGSRWNTVFNWSHGSGDDHRWHSESYNLSSYLTVSNFKIRFVSHQSSTAEDIQIDNVSITGTAKGTTAPAPAPAPAPVPAPSPAPAPAPTPPSTSSNYTVYLADTDDREVLAFSKTGAYQGVFVTARSGGLGKVWDVAFGPDNHLYVSDDSYSKIRKYNGSTGAPISTSSGWATTQGYPRGLVWNGSTLYVATSMGVERFSSTGTSLGYFGDASRNPSTSGAPSIRSLYDVVFCPDNRMYVADRSGGKILYYTASAGTYLGTISGSSPNTHRATGVECGTAMSGSGTSLYQSGDDRGRVNEINPANSRLVRQITSLIDEPYGMDMDGAGVLYVANKDDDNIVKIASGTTSVFATGNRMDDPRGLTTGRVYSGSSSSESAAQPAGAENDGPEIAVLSSGTAVTGSIPLAAGQQTSLDVRVSDPDGDAVTVTAIPDMLPASAISVADGGDGTATVTLSAASVPAGTYVFWISASDGKESEREPFVVVVQ